MKYSKRTILLVLMISFTGFVLFPTIALGEWQEPPGGGSYRYPDSYQIITGTRISGSLGSVYSNDGAYLILQDGSWPWIFWYYNQLVVKFYFNEWNCDWLLLDWVPSLPFTMWIEVHYNTGGISQHEVSMGTHSILLDSSRQVTYVTIFFGPILTWGNPSYYFNIDQLVLFG